MLSESLRPLEVFIVLPQELSDIQAQSGPNAEVTAQMLGDDLTHWKGRLRGPVSLLKSFVVSQ